MSSNAKKIEMLLEIEKITSGKYDLYIVGGLIRDLYFDIESAWNDIDLLTTAASEDVAKFLAQHFQGTVKTYPDFLTAKVINTKLGTDIDLVSSRKEHYPHSGSLPVVSLGDLKSDLWRRDFTINALAVPLKDFCLWLQDHAADFSKLTPSLIDYTAGVVDLEQRQLRIMHPASFYEDPTRIFRLARYLARINGKIESNTELNLQEALATEALRNISNFRKTNEFKKIAVEPQASQAIKQLISWDVLFQEQLLDRISQASFWNDLDYFDSLPSTQRWEVFVLLLFFYAEGSTRLTIINYFALGKKYYKKFEKIILNMNNQQAEDEQSRVLQIASLLGS